MIVRIKAQPRGGGVELTAAICGDDGRELYELAPQVIDFRTGDVLDVLLPGVPETAGIVVS